MDSKKNWSDNTCIYCGMSNVRTLTTVDDTLGLNTNFTTLEHLKAYPVTKIKCDVCHRQYSFSSNIQKEYLKKKINFSNFALSDLKRLKIKTERTEEILDIIFENIVGIAIPSKTFGFKKKKYDICFLLDGEIYSLNSIQANNHLQVLSVDLLSSSLSHSFNQNPIDKNSLYQLLISGQISYFNQQRTKLEKNLDLSSLDLSNCDLSGSDLSYANLRQTNFSNSNLSDTNLSFSNLSNSNMRNVNLTNSKLIETNLQNVDLRLAKLDGVNLQNAILQNSNIIGTFLDFDSLEKKDSIVRIVDGGFIVDTSKMIEPKYSFVYDSILFAIKFDKETSECVVETVEEIKHDFS